MSEPKRTPGAYSNCRLCGERVSFYPTAAGKLIPIAVEESPSGTVVLERHPTDQAITLARVLGLRETHEGRRYVLHRETCAGARGAHAGEGIR